MGPGWGNGDAGDRWVSGDDGGQVSDGGSGVRRRQDSAGQQIPYTGIHVPRNLGVGVGLHV